MRERSLVELLDTAVKRQGMVRGIRRAEAVLAWPRLVGAEVARFARAAAFDQGTLIVEVGDAETAMHLGLQRDRILDAYRQRMPEAGVRALRFRVGRLQAAEQVEPPRAPAEVDPAELEALERAALSVPDELAPAALRAGQALASLRAVRRAAGWLPCRICGTLHEPRPEGAAAHCPTCRRQLSLPRVQRAAERLAVQPEQPTPELTDEERAVARYLARGRLEAQIAALMPRALADPSARPALEVAVRCALGLERGGAMLSTDELEAAAADAAARRSIDERAWRLLGRHRRS